MLGCQAVQWHRPGGMAVTPCFRGLWTGGRFAVTGVESSSARAACTFGSNAIDDFILISPASREGKFTGIRQSVFLRHSSVRTTVDLALESLHVSDVAATLRLTA